MLLQILIGAGLAVATLSLAAMSGLHRERAFYATMLCAIAVFYVVFAVEEETVASIVRQSLYTAPFFVLAAVGYRTKRALIALGLALHALFDVVMHATGGPAPGWWAGLCPGFDGVFALAALRLAPGREALRKAAA